MKRKLVPASRVLLLIAAVVVGRPFLRAEEKVAEVTLEGTVVDMHCFVTHGVHDATHTACANACIERGVPAGFLAKDGTLYLLFAQEPFSVKDQVKNLADVPIRLTGTLVERNGVSGIQIKSIEKARS
jgi:hypothetical protein